MKPRKSSLSQNFLTHSFRDADVFTNGHDYRVRLLTLITSSEMPISAWHIVIIHFTPKFDMLLNYYLILTGFKFTLKHQQEQHLDDHNFASEVTAVETSKTVHFKS